MEPLIEARIKKPVVIARCDSPDAKVDMQERLVRQRGEDEPGRHRGVGAAAKLAGPLPFLDETLDEPPPLRESAGPGREDMRSLGWHLGDDHPLPQS